jgi:glycosyltransferase involved in cell wall biosynthesis
VKVLTVTNLYPPDVIGGYELGCRQMVDELRRRGHDVGVLTTAPRRPVHDDPDVSRELRLVDWHTRARRPPQPPAFERAMDLQAHGVEAANVAALLRHLEQRRPDVVYLWNVAHVGALGLVGALAHLQVPVVWHLMDAVPKAAITVDGVPVGSAGTALSRRLRGEYVVCSEHLRREIEDAGFPLPGAVTVPNWVEPVPAWRDRPTFRPGRELRLVSAGQLAPHKGFDLMIEAARLLLDSGRSWFSLDLYGAGLDDHYRRLIWTAGLQDHVRLGGSLPQDDLVDRFWERDLFLFPTWAREPFGFAPLEAAARGCVPVISDDCGTAEWLVGGVDALKTRRDAGTLAGVLKAVYDGEVDLAGLVARSRRTVAQHFAIGPAADAVERAFTTARERPAVRPGAPQVTYHLARLAERLLQDWAEAPA